MGTTRAKKAGHKASKKEGEKDKISPEPSSRPAKPTSRTAQGAVTKRKTPAKIRAGTSTTTGGSGRGSGKGGDDVVINRAPVLKLWVAVVAQRQGFSFEEGLSFGSYIAGMLAHSKGRSLGIYEDKDVDEEERAERQRQDEEMGVEKVEVFGIKCRSIEQDGMRLAMKGDQAEKPGAVQASLSRAFGSRLDDVKAAMEELAAAIPADRIGKSGYKLYERFRPEFKGWGMKANLSLQQIRDLVHSWQQEP